MRLKFDNFVSENKLFTKKDKLLVAVSGGVDSMALVCLLWENNYDFGIAHCNFQLRGKESEDDEVFVERFATFVTSNFHKKRFDTEGGALADKKSIQETARDMRYEWFEELRQKYDYQYILTAHHRSDSVETMLFNLSRGTGLKGLTGIKPRSGHIIRPLLFAHKNDIMGYVKEHKIFFREDSSNESNKYARNFIRNNVIAQMKTLNPEFEQNALNTITRLTETQALVDFSINTIREQIVKVGDKQTLISIEGLKSMPAKTTILFEILKDFGFNGAQVADIVGEPKTGAKFFSPTHELLIDRKEIIIQPIEIQRIAKNTEGVFYDISEKTKSVNVRNCALVLFKSTEANSTILNDKNCAQLNFAQLNFPLRLRHWQTGDRFQPLGMNGSSQLLSDYFQQQKLSEYDKKNVWILENGDGRICWVVGFRIAEPFKLLPQTSEILTIKLA